MTLQYSYDVRLTSDSVRRNPLTKDATNADIEFVVKQWLRTAPDRVKNSKRNTVDCEVDSEILQWKTMERQTDSGKLLKSVECEIDSDVASVEY